MQCPCQLVSVPQSLSIKNIICHQSSSTINAYTRCNYGQFSFVKINSLISSLSVCTVTLPGWIQFDFNLARKCLMTVIIISSGMNAYDNEIFYGPIFHMVTYVSRSPQMGINLMYEHNAGNNIITYKSFDAMKMFSMHMKSSLKHNLLLHSPFIYKQFNEK